MLHPVENTNLTLPLMFQNMASRNKSIKFTEEPLDRIITSSNVSNFYKNNVTDIYNSENLFPAIASKTKVQKIVQNVTLTNLNTPNQENDNIFEETLELPKKSNLFNSFGNSSRSNSISNSKNQTMQSSNKMS